METRRTIEKIGNEKNIDKLKKMRSALYDMKNASNRACSAGLITWHESVVEEKRLEKMITLIDNIIKDLHNAGFWI